MDHAIASSLRRLLHEDDAADLVEYAFLIGAIAAACLTLTASLNDSVTGLFASLGALLDAQLP